MSKALKYGMPLFVALWVLSQCGRRHAGPAAAYAYSGPVGAPYATSFDAPASPGPWAGAPMRSSSHAGVQLVGRFVVDGPQQIRVGWPNSAIGGRFTGTSIAVEMEDYQPMEVKGQRVSNIFNVTIDDQAAVPLEMRPGMSFYPLAQGLHPGIHTVWVSKRTEGLVGSTYFLGFVPGRNGRLLQPPALRPRRIEFIGASNETGYGNMGNVTAENMCRFSPATQNADIAYPKLVGDALNADVVNISYAGRGVLQNDDPAHDPVDTMPVLYKRSDPVDDSSHWDFSGPAPEVVVVNLGGNDFANEPPSQHDFVAAYTSFLKTLRTHYPKAQIFCVVGPTMSGSLRDEFRKYVLAVVQDRKDSGDQNVTYFEFEQYRGRSLGCDYHPDAALHRSMAAALGGSIADKMGWK